MSVQRDPFSATFGATPMFLVGREKQLQGFERALDNGPGSHERVSIVTGQRGTGKTVLLNGFSDAAKSRGWLVFEETATDGFLERLKNRIISHIVQETNSLKKKELTGIGLNFFALGFSLQWQRGVQDFAAYTLREALEDLFTLLKSAPLGGDGKGVLITIDELHYLKSSEMIQFGAIVQHLVRDGQEIAVALAGIPSSVKPLLSDLEGKNPVTFLRRANRIELTPVPEQEVALGLVEPLEQLAFEWQPGTAEAAIAACRGYPFLIQLVGSALYNAAVQDKVISAQVVEAAVAAARERLGVLVHEPALEDLSARDLDYLYAMAEDNGPSRTAEIAKRLGQDVGYASTYRRRLLEQEIIVSVAQGKVAFAVPYLRKYLREQLENKEVVFWD